MKKISGLIFSLTVFFWLLGTAQSAPFIIYDTSGEPEDSGTAYWGGKMLGQQKDVVGSAVYDFSRMEVSFIGNLMKVQIFGDFTPGSVNQQGAGDLFLSSTGWKVSGTGPHHIGDTFKKDEGWDYVISSSSASGWAGVWKVDWTSLFWTAGGREDQAFYKDAGGVKVGDAAVAFADDSLTFQFIYTGLGSLGPDSFGVHFTQVCGNDVIEGGTVPAPEPSTMLLFAGGFVGFVVKMRRKLFS